MKCPVETSGLVRRASVFSWRNSGSRELVFFCCSWTRLITSSSELGSAERAAAGRTTMSVHSAAAAAFRIDMMPANPANPWSYFQLSGLYSVKIEVIYEDDFAGDLAPAGSDGRAGSSAVRVPSDVPLRRGDNAAERHDRPRGHRRRPLPRRVPLRNGLPARQLHVHHERIQAADLDRPAQEALRRE